MKKFLSKLFSFLAILGFGFTCYSLGYAYSNMLCGIQHAGYSAPPEIAFLIAIPYAAVTLLFAILAFVCRKK